MIPLSRGSQGCNLGARDTMVLTGAQSPLPSSFGQLAGCSCGAVVPVFLLAVGGGPLSSYKLPTGLQYVTPVGSSGWRYLPSPRQQWQCLSSHASPVGYIPVLHSCKGVAGVPLSALFAMQCNLMEEEAIPLYSQVPSTLKGGICPQDVHQEGRLSKVLLEFR